MVRRLVTLPAEIKTARLRLPLVTPAEAAAMRAGRRDSSWHPTYPRPDDVDAASMAREGDTWGPRHIVCDCLSGVPAESGAQRAISWGGGLAVGTIGPLGPPVDGEVEVGYGLVEAARGRGLATEALKALLAATDAAGVRVRAGVRPDNGASLKVLAGCGFTELRGSNDEGALVLARPLPDGGRG
jgi:[ribosomal protein S5]-alanine N-acetyltransferase